MTPTLYRAEWRSLADSLRVRPQRRTHATRRTSRGGGVRLGEGVRFALIIAIAKLNEQLAGVMLETSKGVFVEMGAPIADDSLAEVRVAVFLPGRSTAG
jgi:hypothetical protein